MICVPVHCLGNPKVIDQRITEKIGLVDKVALRSAGLLFSLQARDQK